MKGCGVWWFNEPSRILAFDLLGFWCVTSGVSGVFFCKGVARSWCGSGPWSSGPSCGPPAPWSCSPPVPRSGIRGTLSNQPLKCSKTSKRRSLQCLKRSKTSISHVPKARNVLICGSFGVPRAADVVIVHWTCSMTGTCCNLQHLKRSNVAPSSQGLALVLWSQGRKEGRKEGTRKGRTEGRNKEGKEGRKETKGGRKERRREGRKEGRKERKKEGRKKGKKEGRKEGRNEGRKEETKEGKKEGRKEGTKEGVEYREKSKENRPSQPAHRRIKKKQKS